MTGLKTCPFCGGEAYIDNYRYTNPGKTLLTKTYVVRCSECEVESAEYYSEVEAVDAWNRRADNA